MGDSKTVNCIEWFFGCGGNHLGLNRAIPNLRCVAACEIEAYAIANMVAKMEAGFMDPFPIWTDCKTFPCEPFRDLVDIFIASYPCQGFSCAGQRKGESDPRFLWPWVFRFCVIVRPRRVFFENVDGHVSLGLSTVISDLETAGYRVKTGIFSATEVGAPHQRKRVFILGELADTKRARIRPIQLSEKRNGNGVPNRTSETMAHAVPERSTARPERSRRETGSNIEGRSAGAELESEGVGQADPFNTRRQRSERSGPYEQGPAPHGPTTERSYAWPARPGEPQHEWEPPRIIRAKRGLGGGVTGNSANVDRLRLIGNSVVPSTAKLAYQILNQKLNETP